MIPPRCAAVLLVCLLVSRSRRGAIANSEPARRRLPTTSAPPAAAERYEAMLSANPAEGMSLDRLWKLYEEHNATAVLIDRYRRATDTSDKAADALVYGYLLKRAGRLDEAGGSYARAARLDRGESAAALSRRPTSLSARAHPEEAAASLEEALGENPRLRPPSRRLAAETGRRLARRRRIREGERGLGKTGRRRSVQSPVAQATRRQL